MVPKAQRFFHTAGPGQSLTCLEPWAPTVDTCPRCIWGCIVHPKQVCFVWGPLSASSLGASARLFSAPGTPSLDAHLAPSPITHLCSARTPVHSHGPLCLPQQSPGLPLLEW